MVTTKGNRTRQRILEAAAELFYRQGYHSVGINQVLSAAQAPKGSFYYHFEGKEDVARQAIVFFGQGVLERVSEVLMGAPEGPAAIRGFVKGVSEQVRKGETVASCPLGSLGMQLAASMPELARLADDYLVQLIALLRQFFEGAKDRGELALDTTSEALAKEFLYLYEGSLVISTIKGATDAFEEAMERFTKKHFRNA